MTVKARLTRVGEPALRAIRTYSATSALLVGIMVVSLAAVLPMTSMLHPGSWTDSRLVLPALGDVVAPASWGAAARTPAETQAVAIGRLFELMLCGLAAVVAVAAVTCVSLFGARASQRTTEMSARRAVGASRRLLAGSALLEASILASCALGLGSVAGILVQRRVVESWPGRLAAGSTTQSAIAAGALGALFVLCAMLPVLFARGGRIADDPGAPVPRALPAFQLGLSLIILTSGALLTRHVAAALEGGGASSNQGQVFRQAGDNATPAVRASRYQSLLDALDAGKRFDTVSLTATGNIVGLGTIGTVTTDCGQCSEGGIYLPWHMVPATHQFVSADTFHALGVRLVAGRGITAADQWGATSVAVVSRGLALRHFQRGEAIGRGILLGDDARTWHTVVGIVDDPPVRGLGGSLQPPFTVYASILQHPVQGVDLLIRPVGSEPVDATAVAAVRRALVLRGSTGAPVPESELVAEELRPLRWFGSWIAFEGWAILILACGGTFVLVRLWVISLLSELGLRRALGARRSQVVAYVLLRAAGVGLCGVMAGVWFGPGVWNVLHSVVGDLPVWDGATVARFGLLLLAVVILGAIPPAWRAARTPPGRLLTWT